MGTYVEPHRPKPYGAILTTAPTPPNPQPEEPSMGRQPNQAEIQNAFDRLHIEGYMHELQRQGGIFESPKTYAESRIRDERPGGTAYVDEAYVVHMTHYLDAFAGNGNDHDPAVRHMLQVLHDSDEARQKRGETSAQPPPLVALVPLHIDGTTFRRPDGTIWKYRAVTAFTAFQDFLAGRDLTPYAAWTRSVGGNAWRVFYTWSITNFNPLSQLGAAAFLRELENFRRFTDGQGLYLHNTAFCDQVAGSSVLLSREQQDMHLEQLRVAMQGQFLEGFNEAWKNGGNDLCASFHPDQFSGTFGTRSSWEDGQDPRVTGSILSFTSEHTPRDAEWPRKSKNMLETSRTAEGWPPTGVPAIGGEPMGIYEQDIPGSRTANASDVADYYAVAELFSAGACLHGDGSTLQRCNVPGPNAQRCAEWAKAAREAIPADAQLGAYTRGGLGDCPLVHSDSTALRTFASINGNRNRSAAVVVRPVDGWQPQARNGWRIDRVVGPNGHIVLLTR